MTESTRDLDAMLNTTSSHQRCVDCFLGSSKVRFVGAADVMEPWLLPDEEAPTASQPIYEREEELKHATPRHNRAEEYGNIGTPREDSPFDIGDIEMEEQKRPRVKSVFVPQKEAFGGGEAYRPIYCGMDPANKPKNAIYGNRLQCYRKGFYYGKMHSRHG